MPKTKIVKIDASYPDEEYLIEAAAVIIRGGLVIIPTETVYGIAANMLNEDALSRLYQIKQRPKDKPFSLHIGEKSKVEDYARNIPVQAYKLIDKFWPGPLTLILKSVRNGTIGLRMPDNDVARKIINYAKIPVVCPSANISGRPAPVNFDDAMRDLDGLVDLAIDMGKTELGVESTVIDMTLVPPVILRDSGINKDIIETELKKKSVLFVCTGNSCRSVMAHALLEKALRDRGRSGVEVISAGIMMAGGLSATEETRELLKKEGMDVSNHRSQRVTKEMIKKSDFILVMERIHEECILQLAPEVKNRVFLLKEFAKIDDKDLNIPDPIGRPTEFYAVTLMIIKDAINRIVKII